MKLSEHLALARAFNKEIRNVKDFPDTFLTTLLNNGGVDVTKEAKFFPDDNTFNVVADQKEYNITELSSKFLTMEKSGIYFNTGTVAAPVWLQLWPVTRKYMDEHIRDWRNANSGSPQYYFKEGNTITFYPTPEDSLNGGFKAYFYKKPIAMSGTDDYLFEGTTEISDLIIFDDTVQKYLEWKVSKVLNKTKEIQLAYEQEYIRDRAYNIALYNMSPDVVNSRKMRFRMRRMPKRF